MKVVFDLDGTLADISHRLHFIQQKKKDWDSFFNACLLDKPIIQTVDVARALYEAGFVIEIWSGRSDRVRRETEEWLKRNNVRFHLMRMRSETDRRSDVVLKESWLHSITPKVMWPTLVFEDRSRVVEMWRKNGIRCFQVEAGDY